MNLLIFMRDIIYEEDKECITNYDVEKIFSHKGYLYTDTKKGKIDDVFEEMSKNHDLKNAKGIILSISIKNSIKNAEKIDDLLEKLLIDTLAIDDYVDIFIDVSTNTSLKDDEIILDYVLTGLGTIS